MSRSRSRSAPPMTVSIGSTSTCIQFRNRTHRIFEARQLDVFLRKIDPRVLAAVLALSASACAAPDPYALYRDDRNIARPSNSPVLYPGEYRSQYDWQLWRLPQL